MQDAQRSSFPPLSARLVVLLQLVFTDFFISIIWNVENKVVLWEAYKINQYWYLDFAVHPCWHHKMGIPRKPPNSSNTFRVTWPGVNEFLGKEAFLRRLFWFEVYPHILWWVQKWSALIVVGIFDWETKKRQILQILWGAQSIKTGKSVQLFLKHEDANCRPKEDDINMLYLTFTAICGSIGPEPF